MAQNNSSVLDLLSTAVQNLNDAQFAMQANNIDQVHIDEVLVLQQRVLNLHEALGGGGQGGDDDYDGDGYDGDEGTRRLTPEEQEERKERRRRAILKRIEIFIAETAGRRATTDRRGYRLREELRI